jgi:hypothetical protein
VTTIYSCRLAPCSESWREAIYVGLPTVFDGRRVRESFASTAFIADGKRVPIVLGHDREDEPVGHVVSRIAHGGWHLADFVLDDSIPLSAVAADRLRVGAGVSIGARSLRRDALLEEDGIVRHELARLEHVVICGPGEIPCYRDARITGILKSASVTRSAATQEPADEDAARMHAWVAAAPAGMIRRPGIGRVLGVR